MSDLAHRIVISSGGSPSGGSPSGGPQDDGVVAKVVRAVVGGVVLTATIVAGALMGGVLLIGASILAVGGLAAGLYLRWKLRRIIREQAKQMGEMKPGEPFNYSGSMGGGRFQVFVHEAGPIPSQSDAPTEEPLDVEVLDKDEP